MSLGHSGIKLKFITKVNNPELLVVTPLLTGHKISKETKLGIKRNNVNFDWIAHEGQYNTAKNFQLGIDNYKKIKRMPKYVIMIDKDINPNRHMLDNMIKTLNSAEDHIAYTYANFRFVGSVNASFINRHFDPFQLMRANFISSNSMMKSKLLEEIGGVVTDEKYKRLLDWCLWLKFLQHGYHGVLCSKAYFEAHSDKKSVSAGDQLEYRTKYKLVVEDFVKQLM